MAAMTKADDLGKSVKPDDYVPRELKTPFGLAVAVSGFSRVCPRCYKQWSDEKKWLSDTAFVGSELRPINKVGKIKIGLRQCSCGGVMLTPDGVDV